MTALTTIQRAQVNAALCIIHDQGLDAKAVTATANANIATGHAVSTAYEMALNAFASGKPELSATLGKATRLIKASSSETIAQYDRALSQYIATGDDAAMMALAPMVARDSLALAVHLGEMTAEEAAEESGQRLQNVAATDVQVSAVEGPGLVASGARQRQAHFSGFMPDAPNDLTPAAAYEAARSDAAGVGRGYISPPPREAAQ